MNHIRLFIRNQCGSHIIHGLPNPLAFQQNYSCYDGPSESDIFSPLDQPLLTSYLQKSSLSPRQSLQEFLMQYRRTPLASGYSPSELLNGRQIRTKRDILLPSPAHTAQGKQAREATKSQTVAKLKYTYSVGTPCYALYCGPRRDKDPRWVPATVIKVHGSRSVNVRVHPRGPT